MIRRRTLGLLLGLVFTLTACSLLPTRGTPTPEPPPPSLSTPVPPVHDSPEAPTPRLFDFPTPPPASRPAATDRVPSSVLSSPVLVVGADDAHPNLVDFPAQGTRVTGFDVDLCQALAAHLGNVHCQFTELSYGQLAPALAAHQIDAIIAAYPDTPASEQTLDFVDYLNLEYALLVRKGNPDGVHSLNDLCGKAVALPAGSQLADGLRARCRSVGGDLSVLSGNALTLLQGGQVSAAVLDYPSAVWLSAHPDGPAEFDLVGGPFASIPDSHQTVTPYGIGLRKTDGTLRQSLQRALEEVIADGTYDRLLTTWGIPGARRAVVTMNRGGSAAALTPTVESRPASPRPDSTRETSKPAVLAVDHPIALAVDSRTQRAYVLDQSGTLSVINDAAPQLAILAATRLPALPDADSLTSYRIALDSDSGHLYIGTATGGDLLAYDVSAELPIRIGATMTVPHGVSELAVDPTTHHLLAAGGDGTLDVFDSASRVPQLLGSRSLGNVRALGVDASRHRVYVALGTPAGGSLLALNDDASLSALGSAITLPDLPLGMAVDPDGHQVLIVGTTNRLLIVSTADSAPQARGEPLPLGLPVSATAFDAIGHRLYLGSTSWHTLRGVAVAATPPRIGHPLTLSDGIVAIAADGIHQRLYVLGASALLRLTLPLG